MCNFIYNTHYVFKIHIYKKDIKILITKEEEVPMYVTSLHIKFSLPLFCGLLILI